MVGESRLGEREHLAGLAKRLDDLLAEVARVNRRLRSARNAVHAIESDVTRLCEEVTARIAALDSGNADV